MPGHILADDGEVGPTMKDEWDIYSTSATCDKNTTLNGFRSDLHTPIDRIYQDSLLKSIPLQNTLLCLLHTIARFVEKLLSLEIELVMKQSNVEVQAVRDGPGYVQEKIMNIENNINARGVRQSNFKISFEKNGKPAPVKLNKDAMTIIAPAPTGHADKYPHVLHVCSENLISNSLPKDVKQKLKLQDNYTDFDLVATIWQHFYAMAQIIRHDPPPNDCLNHTETKGSTCFTDYMFGYSDREKEQ